MALVVSDLASMDRTGLPTLSARIAVGGKSHDVYYRSSRGPIADGADSFFIASLLPAMKCATVLHSPWPVSSRLRQSVPRVQDIVSVWDRRLQKVAIDVPSQPVRNGAGEGVGAFFSGGVDSFYTLLKNHAEITDMIFVHGFDVRLDDQLLREKVGDRVRQVAAKLGKRLVEVETNLRSFSSQYVPWDLYFGSALASVATLLGPQFRKVYIPSSHSYAQLYPNGSHPLLDPLWSTEATELIHDGCEADRMEKVRRIISNDVALSHLRVCWENRGGEYNCGRCEKCLRTMVSLYIADGLARCKTFAEPLRLTSVARVPTSDVHVRSFVEENLRAAEGWGKDPRLIRALRDSLDQRYSRGIWRLATAARGLFSRFWRAVRTRWAFAPP